MCTVDWMSMCKTHFFQWPCEVRACGIKIKCALQIEKEEKKEQQTCENQLCRSEKKSAGCVHENIRERSVCDQFSKHLNMFFIRSNFNRIDAIDFFALLHGDRCYYCCVCVSNEWQNILTNRGYCYYFIIILFELIWIEWYAYSQIPLYGEERAYRQEHYNLTLQLVKRKSKTR